VGGVALDRLDQVRDQIVPPLELDIDPAPRLVHAVPRGDDAVPDQDVDHPDEDNQADEDQNDRHASMILSGMARRP
jgi:hypothetical protein